MLGTDYGAGVPGALPRRWILLVLRPALAVAACGGTEGRATSASPPAACVRTASPASCLRYVERVARARSIKLTSKIPLEVQLWVFDRANWEALPPKHPAVRVSERNYAGHSISIWRFPENDGQLEGHDAAFATEHGISYFVSIHGHTHDDGDVAMLLAILAQAD